MNDYVFFIIFYYAFPHVHDSCVYLHSICFGCFGGLRITPSLMDTGGILNQPLVIDNGSGSIKAGIAGDPAPSTTFASFVGRPKHSRAMVGSLEGSAFVGKQAREHRGLLSLEFPIKHGNITNWSDMELLWEHVYSVSGGSSSLHSEEHPVLITEPPMASFKQRENATQLLFETFNVPAVYFALPAVLSLYAAGKTTGLALDVGDGVAHCVPIYQGFALNSAIMRSDLSGSDTTDFLQLLLRKQGIKLMTSAEREIVKEIKESYCSVNPELAVAGRNNDIIFGGDSIGGDSAGDSGSGGGGGGGSSSGSAGDNNDTNEITYKLPDGQRVKINKRELSRAPELLFRPHIFGSEEKPVHRLISDAAARSDMDLRAPLYQSIVLSGGSTLTRGFGDRLLNELKECAPGSTKIRIFAPANRIMTPWIGGSILAGLSTFKKMWITAEEYEEQPNRIHLN